MTDLAKYLLMTEGLRAEFPNHPTQRDVKRYPDAGDRWEAIEPQELRAA